MAILKKPYEISIWKDRLEDSYYKEIRIAVIGSNTMTSPNKAFSPVLTESSNGETTFTFSMAYRYFDPEAQAEVINPFIGYLIEERKVKLYYDDKWYDFLIKNHEENSETNIWTYTCTDAFVNELSKVGYNIEFNTELGNNQGTAVELAKETLKNTDWEVSESDTLIQKVKEPMYKYKVSGSFTALDTSRPKSQENPVNPVTIENEEEIYVFYSYIANKNVEFVQFMRAVDEPSFTFDSNNVIIGTNYRILTSVVYTTNEQTGLTSFSVENATISPMTNSSGRPQYTDKQGFKLAYSQLTTYDSIMGRTVNIYETEDAPVKRVYDFVDSTYTTSDVIMSYVTNGSNFNVYTDGSLQGWSNATSYTEREQGVDEPQEISLTTYPEVAPGKDLIKLTELSRITGYLELRFNNPLTNDYKNTFFNSGFEDNSSFVDHVTKGEKYILRLAAATATEKHGDLTPLNLSTSQGKIRAIVAKYNRAESREGSKLTYVHEVDPNGIVLQFTGGFEENNTIITGGYFNEEETDEHGTVILPANSNYIIDDVVQEPSSECVYVDDVDTEYVWYDEEKKYILKTEADWFVNYYRTITEAQQPLSNSWLSEPTNRIGIFLYVDDASLCNTTYVYISDVQITRGIEYKKPNGDIDYVSIGNVPTATIKETHNYYEEPEENADKTSIDIYYNLSDLESKLGSKIKPVYNEKSEKILSISEAQSNCFNILQTICETFECWLKLEIEHENNGAIKLVDGKPIKKVYFKEYAGKNNFAGFKYGINLNSIQRTINSEEIVTKLIVDNVQSDYVDSGVMSIRNASINPSGEANILNFSYYTNKGLIEDEKDCQNDLDTYYADMKEFNNQLNQKEKERGLLQTALTKIEAKRNVYTELIDTAQDKYMEGLADFEKATGIPYNEYVEKYGKVGDLTADEPEIVSEGEGVYAFGYGYYKGKNYRAVKRGVAASTEVTETIDFISTAAEEPYTYVIQGNPVQGTEAYITSDNSTQTTFTIGTAAEHLNCRSTYCDYDGDKTLTFVRTASGSTRINSVTFSRESSIEQIYELYEWSYITNSWGEPIYSGNTTPYNDTTYKGPWNDSWPYNSSPNHGAEHLEGGDLTNHESIIDIIGQLYVSRSMINDYGGLLTNIDNEYKEYKEKLKGHPTYNFSVSYVQTEQGYETRLELSDYIDNFTFKVYPENDPDNYLEYESSVSQKSFVATSNTDPFDRIEILSVPKEYTFDGTNPIEVPNGIDWYKLEPNEPMPGYEEAIKEIREAKDNREKEFFSKYGKFIKEGTWSSNDYIDADLYYLDAMQVSQTSAFPKIEYSINVAEISELEGLENYTFAAGDKSYIEDTEFFGWAAFYVNNETQESTYIKPADLTGYTIGKTPAREEIIVSQVEWHLDEPETNVITVQNYKTQFEDLFQRISATVQQVQYNEATYAKTASILDANGTINQNLLLASLNGMAGNTWALTTDGSIEINSDEILIKNLTNTSNYVKINSEGIRVSSDGQKSWTTAIDGNGVNAGLITSGELNTQQITIGSRDNPTFRWDKYGLNAYKQTAENEPYDLNTFVRFDQYGLYGVQKGENYKAQSLAEVKRDAQFGLTWDGFFIKNSYTGGGLVQITSDNDFQVINSNQTEKIKIGALEWTDGDTVTTTPIPGIAPSLYGIRINNDAGQTVFKTGDDGNITITGTINANAGNIGGMVVNNDWLRMNYIVLEPGEGIYSTYPYIKGEESNDSVISAYPFWISDEDGSAIFNNVTVRGAIKTSVFEYEEIQAIGGAFIFRPSTTIKTAEAVNVQEDPQTGTYTGDLLITVEKPLILRNGGWYKLSNYNSDDAVDADELTTYGLTHIYQLSKTKVDVGTEDEHEEIKLLGAADILDVVSINDIAGGSVIDMGYETTNPNYNDGIYNYGIGINSSDNYINLPPRAISLFETVVNPLNNPKVSYKYKGILGTLPNRRLNNIDAGPLYDAYMEGTQGIYTNNMYIGDAEKYLAFYHYKELNEQTGELEEKTNLRLVADEFIIASDDSDLIDLINNSVYETIIEYCLSTSTLTNTHSTMWTTIMPATTENYPYLWQRTKTVYNDGSIKYIPDDGGVGDGFYVETASGGAGSPGEDALTLHINSSNGEYFRNNSDTSVLTVTIFKGSTEITSQNQLDNIYGENQVMLRWLWKDYNAVNYTIVPSELLSNNGFTFNIDGTMVSLSKVFQCELIYNGGE